MHGGTDKKGPVTRNNAAYSAEKEISETGRDLNQSNISLPDSNISVDSENIQFNIKFVRQLDQNFTMDGYFTKDYKAGEISFNYKYSVPGLQNGEKTNRQFDVSFTMSFSSSSSISAKSSEKKEDIMDFLRRITREIFSKLNGKGSNISAIVLDPEDLKELASVGDKKVIQMIYHLIEMIKFAIEAKKMLKKDSAGVGEIYQPKRDKVTLLEKEVKKEISLDYSFSVREIKENKPAV